MRMTKGHYREICHTAHIIGNMIEAHLIESYEDESIRKKAEKALKAILEIYQEAGGKF